MQKAASLLELLGAALIVAGIWLWSSPAALIVAGLFLVVAASVVSRPPAALRPARTDRRPRRVA